MKRNFLTVSIPLQVDDPWWSTTYSPTSVKRIEEDDEDEEEESERVRFLFLICLFLVPVF